MIRSVGRPLEQAELEQLYIKLEKRIYNIVYRWLWDREEARDVVQEAFVQIWRARERVNKETIEALLYKTALNLASNRKRSRQVWRFISLAPLLDKPAAQPAALEQISGEQRRNEIRDAIERLPERLRRVLMMCEFSELSYEQISEALSIPPGTVASRRNAALARLRKTLGALEELA